MKKMKKVQLAVSVLGLTAAVAGLALLNAPVQAKAEETAKFAMKNGAAVRAVANEAGIRWETTVNNAWYTANIPEGATEVSFGTLVTAANNVSAVTDLTTEADEVKDLACKKAADFTNGAFTYYSSIVYNNMNEWTDAERKLAYGTELIARSYVKYKAAGETEFTYVYAAANDTARCMRAVALAAYEETNPEKVLTADEKGVVDDYFGTVGETQDFGGYYETATPETVSGSYEAAYLGAKKVGTVADGALTLDGLTLGDKGTLTFFDANGNYAKSTEFQYVTQALTNATFATVLKPAEATTISGKYYTLAEDITLDPEASWTSQTIFNSTLDGNGHKITGLKPSYGSNTSSRKQGGGLFWIIQSASFKNLVVEGVSITNKSMSAFAWGHAQGTSTFENVYVSFLPGLYSYGDIGGLFAQQRSSSSIGNAVVKNCVIYMPEHSQIGCGFVVGKENYAGTITVENSAFIGGNGAIQGGASPAATVNAPEGTVTDAVAAHKAINAKAEADVTFAETAYRADHRYVELTAANFTAEYLAMEGDEIFALTEDLKMASGKFTTEDTARFDRNNKKDFSGVFDGQGHLLNSIAIKSNSSIDYVSRGLLFKAFSGSVKNLRIRDMKVGSSDYGTDVAILATSIPAGTTAYIENVLINVGELTTTGVAAVISPSVLGSLSMKDVVVYTSGTANDNVSLVGTVGENAVITTENCYFINEWETQAAQMASGEVSASFFTGVKSYIPTTDATALDQFNADYVNDVIKTVGTTAVCADFDANGNAIGFFNRYKSTYSWVKSLA